MPFQSPKNHNLLWTDLVKECPCASWTEIASFLYHKDHGYSNYKKCKKRDHLEVREEVFQDGKIKRYLVADEKNKFKVDKILDEMCHLLSIQCNPARKLKFAGGPFMKCISRIYSNIYVTNHLLPLNSNEKLGLNLFCKHYLQMSKELPIVILPTHRSYMDFLFITYIMFLNELPLPIVAAGDNFKAMGKFLTDFLKGTGAFLVRRNAHFKKDIDANVYYDILRAYVHSIITGGENALEFFMEGTRTRSGQVLRPKTGLLSMVVDMYLNDPRQDVYIIPVSISYQRPIEEQLYVAENTPQIGMRKPKESAKNLVAAMETIVKRKYGKVYVRFTKPFKLSEYSTYWKKSAELTSSEVETSAATLQELTNSLATKVCLDQAYNNVLMPFTLIAYSAVFRSFLVDQPVKQNGSGKSNQVGNVASLEFHIMAKDFVSLEELLKQTHPQFVPGWQSHLEMFEEFQLNRDGIIRSRSDRKCVEFNLDAQTFHTLLYYCNQLTQMILPVAICILLTYGSDSSKLHNTSWEQYKSIRYLLSREFLVDSLSLEKEFNDSMNVVKKGQISTETKSIVVEHFIYFIRCYLVFLYYLKEKQVLNKLKFLEHQDYELRERKKQYIFISKDMLKNMIDLVNELEVSEPVLKEHQQSTNSKPIRVNPLDQEISIKSCEKLEELTTRFEQVLEMSNGFIQNNV